MVDGISTHLAIEKVRSFNPYKTWKQESNLLSVTFKSVNVGYGKNGAGKSSLVRILRDTYSGELSSMRIYDKDYVDRVLLMENRSGINGVISNFGERDVELEKKIRSLGEVNDKLANDLSEKKRRYSDLEQSVRLSMSDIFNRRKGSNSHIKNKPFSKTVREIFGLWVEDYGKAVEQFPKEDFSKITGDTDYTEAYNRVNDIVIPEWDEGLDAMEELCDVFQETLQSLDVPSSEIVKWVEEGIAIHESEQECQFCGSRLDLRAIREKVLKYKEDKKHRGEAIITAYREKLELLKRNFESLYDSKELRNFLEPNDDVLEKMCRCSVSIGQILRENFATKLSNMSLSFDIQKELSQCIDNAKSILDALSVSKQTKSDEATRKINKLETILKGAIGCEIKNNLVIDKNFSEMDKLAEEQNNLEKRLKNNAGEIKRLQSQKSDLSDFSDYLNGVLLEAGVDFSLEVEDGHYVLRHTDGQALSVDGISEGERNLLALVYFYFEMLENESGEIKEEIRLVIVDDPSSSLDSENYFYITELMKELLRKKDIQVFILTHYWSGFCDMVYGLQGNDRVKCFEVIKARQISNIVELPNGSVEPPYKRLYKEVYVFTEIAVEDISQEQSLHMPNTIRRVLEEYVKFKLNVDFATSAKSGEIAKAIYGVEKSELSSGKRQRLNVLLNVCNILSHKASNHPKEPKEIHDAARTLINAIKENDKYHHLKMIE